MIKKRRGRKPLPEGEKKQKVSFTFYLHPKDAEIHGGIETIRQEMEDYFRRTYITTVENDTEPPV